MQTFDDVIRKLESIVDWSEKNHSRIGYFAALYKNITILVKLAATKGNFENQMQLEKLDVVFAQRYFDAYDAHQKNTLTAASPWYIVFQINETRRLTLVQHLILSINVHINFDLPIACAEISPNEKILTICNDYFQLNTILASSIKGVEKGIFRLSPLLCMLARTVPKIERKLLNFSLNVARSKSWECACQQAISSGNVKQEIIKASREGTNKMSNRIISPGFFATPITFFISLLELHSIKSNISILNESMLSSVNKEKILSSS